MKYRKNSTRGIRGLVVHRHVIVRLAVLGIQLDDVTPGARGDPRVLVVPGDVVHEVAGAGGVVPGGHVALEAGDGLLGGQVGGDRLGGVVVGAEARGAQAAALKGGRGDALW